MLWKELEKFLRRVKIWGDLDSLYPLPVTVHNLFMVNSPPNCHARHTFWISTPRTLVLRLASTRLSMRSSIQNVWAVLRISWSTAEAGAETVNYRPTLSSERALQNNKQQLSKKKSQGESKIGRGSQMGAWWHQDGLADWLSVVMWLWLGNSTGLPNVT
jgi:hypothetical protein